MLESCDCTSGSQGFTRSNAGVNSRHAMHRGFEKHIKYDVTNINHSPSDSCTRAGGRPVLKFAQQPHSVVGDVVLWCSS